MFFHIPTAIYGFQCLRFAKWDVSCLQQFAVKPLKKLCGRKECGGKRNEALAHGGVILMNIFKDMMAIHCKFSNSLDSNITILKIMTIDNRTLFIYKQINLIFMQNARLLCLQFSAVHQNKWWNLSITWRNVSYCCSGKSSACFILLVIGKDNQKISWNHRLRLLIL